MSVVQVTSRQFRDHQKEFLDMVAEGVHVIIKRGKQAFTIAPVSDDDLYFTPEMLKKIDRSIQQIKEGKGITVSSKEELRALFDNI